MKHLFLKVAVTGSLVLVAALGFSGQANAGFFPFEILDLIFGHHEEVVAPAPVPSYVSSVSTTTNTKTVINGSANSVYNTYAYSYNSTMGGNGGGSSAAKAYSNQYSGGRYYGGGRGGRW